MTWKRPVTEHYNPAPDGYPVARRRGATPSPSLPKPPPPFRLKHIHDQPLEDVFGGSMFHWCIKRPEDVVNILTTPVDQEGWRAWPKHLVHAWQLENQVDLTPYIKASPLESRNFGRFPTAYRSDPFASSADPYSPAEIAAFERERAIKRLINGETDSDPDHDFDDW